MKAILTIAGQQFKVEEGQEIFVHRLDADEGESVSLDDSVMMTFDGDKNLKLGSPALGGVKATVLEHVKGDKVIVFKKKRRQGYKRKRGHRQQFSKIRIDSIL